MNRRSFIGNFASALAGFSILPSANLYQRHWKIEDKGIKYEDLWIKVNDCWYYATRNFRTTPSFIEASERFIYKNNRLIKHDTNLIPHRPAPGIVEDLIYRQNVRLNQRGVIEFGWRKFEIEENGML